MRFVPSSRILRILRRTVIVAAVAYALVLGIGLLPGKMEGVYHPPSFAGTCGCGGVDWYYEFTGGRMNWHSRSGDAHNLPSFYFGDYVSTGDGIVEVRLRPDAREPSGAIICKAYPHLLLTHFVSTEGGKTSSSWRWKLPMTSSLRRWLSGTQMIDHAWDPSGIWKRTYDHDGNLLEEVFHPRKPKS